MKKYHSIPEAFTKARKNKKMSQKALADAIGYRQPFICNLEKGMARVDFDKAMMIAALLETDFETIFYDPDAEFTLPELNPRQLSVLEIDIFSDMLTTIESSFSYDAVKVRNDPRISANLYKLLKFLPVLISRIESVKKQLVRYEAEVYQSGALRVCNFEERSCSGDHYTDFEYQKNLERKYHHMVLCYIYSSTLFNRISLYANKEEHELLFNLCHYSLCEQREIKEKLIRLIERSILYVNADHLERLIAILEEISQPD